MTTREIVNVSELGEVAQAILASPNPSKGARVLGLSGDLGVGKTAFVKALAKVLGVRGEITSPTFVIMKSYPIPDHPRYTTLTHIDAYRIESEEEMRVLGFPSLVLDPTRLICVEWPERIPGVLPPDTETLTLAITDNNTRTISYGS